MPFWGAAFFITIAGLWLALRVLQISKKIWPKILMPTASIALISLAISTAASFGNPKWERYSVARFEQARAENNKVVVVDFTADWCLTCKFLKSTVLDRNPVRKRTDAQDVVLFEADVTSKADPARQF